MKRSVPTRIQRQNKTSPSWRPHLTTVRLRARICAPGELRAGVRAVVCHEGRARLAHVAPVPVELRRAGGHGEAHVEEPARAPGGGPPRVAHGGMAQRISRVKPLELPISCMYLLEKGKNYHSSRTSRNGAFLRTCLFFVSFDSPLSETNAPIGCSHTDFWTLVRPPSSTTLSEAGLLVNAYPLEPSTGPSV